MVDKLRRTTERSHSMAQSCRETSVNLMQPPRTTTFGQTGAVMGPVEVYQRSRAASLLSKRKIGGVCITTAFTGLGRTGTGRCSGFATKWSMQSTWESTRVYIVVTG